MTAMAASNQVDSRVKVVELIHTGHGIPPTGALSLCEGSN